jgi:hypothetical protein
MFMNFLCTSRAAVFLVSKPCVNLLRAEAEGSLGAAARSAFTAGGGVVPEQPRKVRTGTCNSIVEYSWDEHQLGQFLNL